MIQNPSDQTDLPLEPLPGVSLSRNGGHGQVTSLSLRGAPSEHTLVLWDGIRWNDPLHPGRGADLSLASSWLAGSVEVSRGPHSVVHGSDGLGGVVQILPWAPPEARKAEVQQGAGSWGTWDTRARASAASDHGSWQLASGFLRSSGISAADSRDGNTESDGWYRSQTMARMKRRLGERHEVRASGLLTLAKTDTDANGGPGGDRTGTHGRNRLGALLAGWETLWGGGIRSELQLSELRHTRTDNTAGDTQFRSRTRQGSLLLHRASQGRLVTAGLDLLEEAGNSSMLPGRVRARTLGGFAQVSLAEDPWFAAAGARIDRHDRFGTVGTLRAAPGVWILPRRLRWKISSGTAFKAPSLWQLSSSSPGLLPERALAWDTGVEWLDDEAGLEVAAFENRFRQLIEYDLASSRYQNTGAARTWGVESALRSPRWRKLSGDATWTWLRTRKLSDGTELLRKPRHQAALGVELEASRRTRFRLQGLWKGRRWDSHPTQLTRQRMPSWFTLGFQARWEFAETWRLHADLENLLHRRYQDTSGYGTGGRSGMLRVAKEL